MKKLLVLTAALALISSSAFAATIVGGAHDLSTAGVGTDEVCVFCHTPHNADTLSGTFPLSNRGAYGSAMCMGCHDGTVAYGDMSNPPNSGSAGTEYSFTGDGQISVGNQHPVGATAIWTASGGTGMQASNTLGVASGTAIECYSCHDVHNPAGSPFLKIDNSGSDLCLNCHLK